MIHAIDVAVSQLGTREATGNNDGTPAVRYMRGDKLPWCAGFVMWCFEQSDDPPVPEVPKHWWRYRAVKVMHTALWQRGLTIGRNVLPLPNDLVFFNTRGDSDAGEGWHVGIVEKVEREPTVPTNYSILTIEGNRANSVGRGLYEFGDPRIVGFARIVAT